MLLNNIIYEPATILIATNEKDLLVLLDPEKTENAKWGQI